MQRKYGMQGRSYDQKLLALTKVKAIVRNQRMEMPRIGTRKLYYLLKEDLSHVGIKIGRDGLFDCLRRAHMLIKLLSAIPKTTWSKHWLHKYPNLVKNMIISKAEQLWVSDITYIKTKKQDCYLSLVTDAYSRKIMGFYVSEVHIYNNKRPHLSLNMQTPNQIHKEKSLNEFSFRNYYYLLKSVNLFQDDAVTLLLI